MTTPRSGLRDLRFPLVLVIVTTAFLGAREMQPWDEALYAIRARACIEHGAWLDQSAYAVGDLYSAAHPPLGVWSIALSTALLGESVGATRLPGALCAGALFAAFFWYIRTRYSLKAALAGTATLGLAQHVQHFARQGQLDAFQMLFTGLAALVVFSLFARVSRRGTLLLAGLIAGAFLSKFLVTGLAIAGWLLAAAVLRRPAVFRAILIAALLGTVLASPWYLFMWSRHPGFPSHLLSAVSIVALEGYSRTSVQAWWYYVNQLLIAAPLLPLLLLARPQGDGERDAFRAALLWLGSALVLLSLGATKLPHFVLHLALPAAFAVAFAAHRTTLRAGAIAGALVASSALVAWGSSETLRLSLRTWTLLPDVPALLAQASLVPLLVAAVLFLLPRLLRARDTARRDAIARDTAGVLLLVAMLVVAAGKNHAEAYGHADGAAAAAAAIEGAGVSHLVILCGDVPHARYQPQLAWYLHGWNLGQRSGKTTMVLPARDALRLPTPPWNAADSARTLIVRVHDVDPLYVPTTAERALETRLDALLARTAVPYFDTPLYSLSRPRR